MSEPTSAEMQLAARADQWRDAAFKAEAELTALRAGIQALADEWGAVPYVMYETEVYQDHADDLRALLSTPEETTRGSNT